MATIKAAIIYFSGYKYAIGYYTETSVIRPSFISTFLAEILPQNKLLSFSVTLWRIQDLLSLTILAKD